MVNIDTTNCYCLVARFLPDLIGREFGIPRFTHILSNFMLALVFSDDLFFLLPVRDLLYANLISKIADL